MEAVESTVSIRLLFGSQQRVLILFMDVNIASELFPPLKIGDKQTWLAVFPPHCSPVLTAARDLVLTWTNTHSSKLYSKKE